MPDIRFTLVTDGSSDKALIPILTWTLRQQGVRRAIQPVWADLLRVPRRPRQLAEKLVAALDLYPCDLLFVHRDAEREPLARRRAEIAHALAGLEAPPPTVCVIPVRMQEAWLLFDVDAIRAAAGNPNGRNHLELPRLGDIEGLPNPKQTLRDLIRQASELTGRRLDRLDDRPHRVAEFIEDFAPLRNLPAFHAFEDEVALIIARQGWH